MPRSLGTTLVASLFAMCVWLPSTGCATASLGTARLVEPGETTLAFGTEVAFAGPRLSPDDDVSVPSLVLTSQVRRGFERWDAGIRVWGLGVPLAWGAGFGVDGRYMIRPESSEPRRWALVAGFGGGYQQLNQGKFPTHLPFVESAFLFGRSWESGRHIAFGLRLTDRVMLGQDVTPVNMLFWGSSFAYERRMSRGRTFFAEINLSYAGVSFNGVIEDEDQTGLPIMSIGIGWSWGL